ncbi:MAG TPA: ThiF family adenylyltransferase [Lacipirellulaceae bacterium]|nr:ThiF family adenylyltransferase [Lacipirellulaceae bacterium]
MTADRYQRQRDLVPQEPLAALQLSVIGVGAVGRQVALQLAVMGARRLQLVDHDVVEPVNLAVQGYRPADLGRRKVAAAAAAIAELDPDVQLELVPQRWRPRLALGDAAMVCVDAIAVRAALWRAIGSSVPFWCDGRMRGETLRVLAAADAASRAHYGTTLFPPSEAQAGPCTARSTIYGASIAAGLMVHQLARWLRGLPVEPDVVLDLLAGELVVGG